MIDGFLTMVGPVHYVLPLSVVSECIDVPRRVPRRPGPHLRHLRPARRGAALHRPGRLLRRGAQPRRRADGAAWSSCATARCASRWWSTACWVNTRPSSSRWPASSATWKALAGSTILGSGDVALVLDMQGLMAAATQASQASSPARTGARLTESDTRLLPAR
jgi:two-component system chemotaxis sensor kinase CheA